MAKFAARGIPQDQAIELLALAAEQIQDEKVIAKARRTGMHPDDIRAADLGREIARRYNAKLGRTRK